MFYNEDTHHILPTSVNKMVNYNGSDNIIFAPNVCNKYLVCDNMNETDNGIFLQEINIKHIIKQNI